MNIFLADEAIKFLETRRLPGRLTVAQASLLLGFHSVDLPVLIGKRLLRPLGKPAPNAIKYFARREIERLADDSAWLSRATQTMYEHWHKRNKGNMTGSD
jgi:hypothetical protein